MWIRLWRVSAASLLSFVAGCAGVPLQSGQTRVAELVQSQAGVTVSSERSDTDQSVRGWLREPWAVSTAVQIAMLRNPTLQMQFARLGVGAADVFEASRLSNPGLSLAVLLPLGGASGDKLTAGASLSFSELLLRHVRTGIAESEYRRTQELVAASILDLAVDVQRAWFDCVGATQKAAVRRTIVESAQTSADLAERYHQAGNIDQLALQLQASAASEAQIAAQQAAGDVTEARARLQALLGLTAEEASWSVPDSLPEPLTAELNVLKLQTLARTQRLDLAAARSHVSATDQQLLATHHYRYLGPTDLGVAGEREADGSKRVGPSVSLALPVFNQGQGAIARAEAESAGARAAQQLVETQIGNEVQLQADRMRLARAQAASYRDGLIPQREAVVARLQEQVNFMLTDTFNLLLAKQQEYAAYVGYIDAVQSYWSARTELMRAVGTRLPDEATPPMKKPQVQP